MDWQSVCGFGRGLPGCGQEQVDSLEMRTVDCTSSNRRDWEIVDLVQLRTTRRVKILSRASSLEFVNRLKCLCV